MSTPSTYKTKEYIAWRAMRNRCYNKTCSKYKYYGGRGVTMDQRWYDSFGAFLEDVGHAPSQKHSSDRFPNIDGNYEPGNFRWATREEQDRNKRNNIFIEHNGMKFIMSDWGNVLGISRQTMRYWHIIKGYSIAEIIKIKNLTL